MKAVKAILLALAGLAAGAAVLAAPAPKELQPFIALYEVKYGRMGIGDSRLELQRADGPGRWVLKSEADASGLARLIAGNTLVQTSTILVEAGEVRPLRFKFDDGQERKQEDIELGFDWATRRVTGTAKGELVDLPLEANAQDPVSNQLAAMLDLLQGRQPEPYAMYDSPKGPKVYAYRFVKREPLETAAGTFDTVVYATSREGSSRETMLWLAPALGYLAVQVESYRKGKRGFSMYLSKYVSGG